jgi:hypothetical protein
MTRPADSPRLSGPGRSGWIIAQFQNLCRKNPSRLQAIIAESGTLSGARVTSRNRLMRHHRTCLIALALITASAARAQQGTTTNLNIGTVPGARMAHAPGFTIKQRDGSGKSERQIGKPKYESNALGRSGPAAGAGTARSRK